MSEAQAERSRLLNKQQLELQELKKDLKKKKGAYLKESQKKYDEAVERHKIELKELENKLGMEQSSSTEKSETKHETPKEEETSKSSKNIKTNPNLLKQKNWGDMSKKDLEEECANRGLSKKGNKEQLIVRLVTWIQGQSSQSKLSASTQKESESESGSESDEEEEKPTKLKQNMSNKYLKQQSPEKKESLTKEKTPKEESESDDEEQTSQTQQKVPDKFLKQSPMKKVQINSPQKESESEEEEEDESEEEEDEIEGKGGISASEEENKQRKREQIVRKAIRVLLQKNTNGFPASQIPEKLLTIGVKNFRPQALGYESLQSFLKAQSETLLYYDRKTGMILPPFKKK